MQSDYNECTKKIIELEKELNNVKNALINCESKLNKSLFEVKEVSDDRNEKQVKITEL